MKHLEHTLETYVYSHYNMCSIPIYFCNIDIQHCNIPLKHPKHLKYTLATCAFSAISPCCLDEWRLIVAELDVGVEIGGSAWSTPVQQQHGPPTILQRLLAALLLLLQRRCSLDRSRLASSARRGWGAAQLVLRCGMVGEGHGTMPRRGTGRGGGRGRNGADG